ncbi:MAG: efflux RND transporter periplasmic adaptor subunit [Armatimonadetes bacterium]|nr:efflux RND transporter periplasmic adaptor subunit [Armatimonadota bacterium]
MRRIYIVLGVLLVGVIGAWMWMRDQRPTTVHVAKAEKASLDLSFTAEAFVVGKTYDLTSEIAGRITQIPVREGDQVVAGQLLMQLDDADAKIALAGADMARSAASAGVSEALSGYQAAKISTESAKQRAGALVQQADANLARVNRGTRVEAINQAKHEVERLAAIESESRKRLARSEMLLKEGAIAPAQRDSVKMEHDAAAAQVRAARDALRQMENDPLPEEVKAAQAALNVAKTDLALSQRTENELNVRRAQVASAEARLKQADADIARLRTQLSKYSVRAPVSGVVIRRYAEPGTLSSPLTVALRVATNEDLHIEAEIRSEDLDVAREGMMVGITLPSQPGTPLKGRIERLSSIAEPKPDATIRTRIVRAWIRILESKERFVPGLEVDVHGEQKQPIAISVPSDAVMVSGGAASVFVVSGAKVSRREVKIGRSAFDKVEVLQGLKAGDTVVVSEPQKLKDGQEVEVAS